MRCMYCHKRIYFTGILYRTVDGDSRACYASPDGLHQH